MIDEKIEELRKAVKIMKNAFEKMEKEEIEIGTIYVTMALIMAKIEKMGNMPKHERDEVFEVARKIVDEIDEEEIKP
jgi:uncharacterized protein (UPF0147 family)